MKMIFPLILLAAACTPPMLVKHSDVERSIATAGGPVLKYISFKNGQAQVDLITQARWEGKGGGFSDGGRQDALIKMWSANTRERSNSGQKHEACFDGLAQDVQKAFFDKNNGAHVVRDLTGSVPKTKAAYDGMALGLQFEVFLNGSPTARKFTFRLPNCLAGKSAVDAKAAREIGLIEKNKFDVNSYDQFHMSPGRVIASGNADGFLINDEPQTGGKNLPKFSLRVDRDQKKEVYPWKNADIRDEAGAMKLAFVLQKYIYENMANQDPANPDNNFIAEKNTKRTFCHTPWLNQGPSGREGIHGLTKERDLKPSPMMDVYAQATAGSDWGISYYNGPGCNTIADVYGTSRSPSPKANFDRSLFPNDTFGAKILFTTANFPNIKGAYSWQANVSEPGSTFRSLKTVRHIQMDITVKDSSIKGTNANLNHWIMYTYYYDPDYDFDKEYKKIVGTNPLASIPNLPKGLLKMRPMGVQHGFGERDGIIFQGAQTNGVGGRLNGPADNPKGSCLGCHATSGIAGKAMVPGFMSNSEWRPSTKHLDFSQQFALGKRNLETAFDDK